MKYQFRLLGFQLLISVCLLTAGVWYTQLFWAGLGGLFLVVISAIGLVLKLAWIIARHPYGK